MGGGGERERLRDPLATRRKRLGAKKSNGRDVYLEEHVQSRNPSFTKTVLVFNLFV